MWRAFCIPALLLLCCVAAAPVEIRAAGSAKRKPNIVLILADDVCYDNIGCYGSDFFSTPRIDALAATGIKFTHCFSEPVCTPSRVKLMTGRDGIRNYVGFGTLDPKETTFGTMLKAAGYATAVAGKWQLQGKAGQEGSLAPACGFDTFCLWNYPGATNRQRYWKPGLIQDGQPVPVTEKSYGPDICTDFLVNFIREKRAQPFFVYYPIMLSHGPFLPTPDSKDPLCTDELQNYRDMVRYLDKCVGRIVDEVAAAGHGDDTVVLFTTDNGTARRLSYPFQGEQRQGEKAWAKDGGYHAPLIVNMPGTVPPGKVSDNLIDFADFLPTLAQIGGAALPNITLDGRSFWPQCLGQKGDPKPWVFQYYFPLRPQFGKEHGQGVEGRELSWVNNAHYKLYRDGALYDLKDREETAPIKPGKGVPAAEKDRKALQAVLDLMPDKAAKLSPVNAADGAEED